MFWGIILKAVTAMNNIPLFIFSNREISSRCLPIPFNIWIPDNTSLEIIKQKKVKIIQQANEFVTFHWDQTFFPENKTKCFCIHQSLRLR